MAESRYVIVRREPDDIMRRAAVDVAPMYPEFSIANGERQRTDRRVSITDAECAEIFTAMISASPPPVSMEEIVEVLGRCLNYIGNTESELGIELECGTTARDLLSRLLERDESSLSEPQP